MLFLRRGNTMIDLTVDNNCKGLSARYLMLNAKAFFTTGPVLWNSLPDNIKQITNIQQFKKELKTFLFRLAYQ